jgi:predicted kinase
LYRSYRAYVRGKVLGFQLDDKHIKESKKQKLLDQISMYFDLSAYYASLINIQINQKNPIVFMMSGLTGTGKSTVAEKLSIDYNAVVINTDIVRKEESGIDKFERHLDHPNTGLYSPERVHYTYEKVIENAKNELKKGNNVILDATFQKHDHRTMAKNLAKQCNALLIPVFCTCPESIAKQWLDDRLKSKSVSDGRWEIYQMQKDSFDMFSDEEQPVIIDTSETMFASQLAMFSSIVERINKW